MNPSDQGYVVRMTHGQKKGLHLDPSQVLRLINLKGKKFVLASVTLVRSPCSCGFGTVVLCVVAPETDNSDESYLIMKILIISLSDCKDMSYKQTLLIVDT